MLSSAGIRITYLTGWGGGGCSIFEGLCGGFVSFCLCFGEFLLV